MKILVSVILTALVSFALGLYLPWWTVALAGFIVAMLIYQSPGRSFLAGFSGVFLLWAILAWKIDSANNSLLAPKIAAILPFGGSIFLLILVTAILGGLIGGSGAITGSLLRRIKTN
jgi:hypothetical protein